MEALGFVAIWVIVVAIVVLVAFTRSKSGQSQPTRFSRTPKLVRLLVAIALLAIGAGIPVWAIASSNDQVVNGSGDFMHGSNKSLRDGRIEFRRTCAACHTLAAANARGIFGPNLDRLPVTKELVAAKIESGGADSGVMPARLLTGERAAKVASYVESVGGLQAP